MTLGFDGLTCSQSELIQLVSKCGHIVLLLSYKEFRELCRVHNDPNEVNWAIELKVRSFTQLIKSVHVHDIVLSLGYIICSYMKSAN